MSKAVKQLRTLATSSDLSVRVLAIDGTLVVEQTDTPWTGKGWKRVITMSLYIAVQVEALPEDMRRVWAAKLGLGDG